MAQHRHSIGVFYTKRSILGHIQKCTKDTAYVNKGRTFLTLTILTILFFATALFTSYTALIAYTEVLPYLKSTHNQYTTLSTQYITLSKSTHQAYLQAKHNTTQHSLLGNRNGKNGKHWGYKLAHWNKGSAHFHNKLHEIAHILDTHKPHIFSISEANLHLDRDTFTYNLHNYNIETDTMAQITDISRQALLIKKGIHYTRRHDLEHKDTCTIWVEIHTANKKSFLVMGGYRQWQLPQKHPLYLGSNVPTQMYARFMHILTNWALALHENKHTIVMMDDNLDTIKGSNHNAKYNTKTLKDAFFRHTQDHGIVLHNTMPTRFQNGTTPSCIDHISSNCPLLIHNTTTHHSGASDHSILTALYTTQQRTDRPTYRQTRDTKLLTRQALEQYIDNSTPLAQLFSQNDCNTVADTLMFELNNMINSIAPPHRTQLNKKHAPFVDTKTLAQIDLRRQHYRQARLTDRPEDWRQYRHTNNLTNKLIKQRKIDYYSDKFDTTGQTDKTMWTTLKSVTKTNTQQTPTHLVNNNTFVTSPRAIANIANTHYINKINTIRNSFKKLTLNPMHILSTLIPRQEHTLTLPLITLTQTIDIINNAQHSHSTGHDSISTHTIKKIKHKVAPFIQHLINTIIKTSTFPDTFKHSRITPTLKPKKNCTLIDSFRPINNLCTLDKIVEQHIKTHLDTFLEAHKIINNNHHGGR